MEYEKIDMVGISAQIPKKLKVDAEKLLKKRNYFQDEDKVMRDVYQEALEMWLKYENMGG